MTTFRAICLGISTSLSAASLCYSQAQPVAWEFVDEGAGDRA